MPIRRLLSEAGGVIQSLKPCFMMSPVSIAQFLDPKAVSFDVIIFDEASQLLIHHALMAMPCAKRYIFVGDHQQMPPVIQGYHKGNPVVPVDFTDYARRL